MEKAYEHGLVVLAELENIAERTCRRCMVKMICVRPCNDLIQDIFFRMQKENTSTHVQLQIADGFMSPLVREALYLSYYTEGGRDDVRSGSQEGILAY